MSPPYPPRPESPAWLASALTALRVCCAEAGHAVTKDQFTVWTRTHPPFHGPERMVKRSGKSWLVWLAEAGYRPSQAQRNAAGRRSSTSRAARREREAKQERSRKPCLNDALHLFPREGNRYCESCHRAWESVG